MVGVYILYTISGGAAIVREQKLFSSTNTPLFVVIDTLHHIYYLHLPTIQYRDDEIEGRKSNHHILKKNIERFDVLFFFNFWPFKSVFLPLGLFRTNSFFSFSLDNNTY